MSDTATRLPDPRLTAIVGHWRTSGHVIGDPQVPVVGTDIYELFAGGHSSSTTLTSPSAASRCERSRSGEPDGEGGYLGRSYDSDGNAEVMHLRIDDDGVFHFAGGGEIAPAAQPQDAPTARVRSTLTVARTEHRWRHGGNDPKTARRGNPGWRLPSPGTSDHGRAHWLGRYSA